TPEAGNQATIVHAGSRAKTRSNDTTPQTSVVDGAETTQVDLAKLMHNKDAANKALVQDGDVITISPAPIVYVVGAVIKPGGYVLHESSSGITVLQALAMAE